MIQILLFEVQNSADAHNFADAEPRADVRAESRAEHGADQRADG